MCGHGVDSLENELVIRQLSDPKVKALAEQLEMQDNDKFILQDGLVYRTYKEKKLFYLPESMVNNVIRIYHDESGHVGTEKTVNGILNYYWFPCLRFKVKEHITNCVKCMIFMSPAGLPEGEMQIMDKGTEPFETLHIDHYGPLGVSDGDYKFVTAIIDAFTKYIFLFPTKSTGHLEVIYYMELLMNIFGIPGRLISDRGTAFTATAFENFLKDNDIEHIKIATGSPWANGQIERYNRFLRSVLSKEVGEQEEWKKLLPKVQYVMNNTYNRAIDATPSKVLLGYNKRFHSDAKFAKFLETFNKMDTDLIQERDNLRERAQIAN